MTLLIDNYDSFAYNLYQYIGTIDPAIRVIRNDELPLDDIERLQPEALLSLRALVNRATQAASKV